MHYSSQCIYAVIMARTYSAIAVILIVPLLQFVMTDEIHKCIKVAEETIRLVCPGGYILYNPDIMVGVSSCSSCVRSQRDCTGRPKVLQRQLEKCHWKRNCKITISRNTSLTCGNMEVQQIHYAVIKQPYCMPKEKVIDVCPSRIVVPKRDNPAGVIRSHKRYPRKYRYRKSAKKCTIDIPLDKTQSIVLAVVTKKERCSKPPRIYTRYGSLKMRIDIPKFSDQSLTFHGNSTNMVTIVARYRRSKKAQNGFVVPYSVYDTKSLVAVQSWPQNARSIMRDIGRIFEARAVIEQCTVNNTGTVTLKCKPNEIIYSPALSQSAFSSRAPSKCMFGRYPCGGLTSDILVQRNGCYWRNTCNITWHGPAPIILSKQSSCIGYQATHIGFTGHRCIPKRDIIDMCTKPRLHSDTNWGVIRSHPNYPWYFDLDQTPCKHYIKIGRGHLVWFHVQDINLDPDGRDKFVVKHVLRGHTPKVLMDAKSAREGEEVIAKGGRLKIYFQPFKDSKSGRGFIIVFRRYKAPSRRSDKSDGKRINGQVWLTGINGIQGDSSSIPKYTLPNRRLCAQRRKGARGRACNQRVWTDYFVRLE